MYIFTLILLSFLCCFLLSLIIGNTLIKYFHKFHINQSLSVYLSERHNSKKNTPTMGGIIFILSTLVFLIFLYYLKKINISYNFLIVIFTFLSYFFIGFLDDYLIIKKHNNKGLSENMKLLLQSIIALILFLMFLKSGNEPLLWIHALNIKINIGFFYGVFILLVLLASSNAVNITDGLDGLATGLSITAFLTFGVISLNTGWLEGYTEIAIFCFAISGSLLGFLFYNINPAKIFMGDTGSLSLGATLGIIAILTRHELLFILIGIVFVIEMFSCVIQRYYYKLTKKRFFKMAPIHHTFEIKGYSERDIVKMFWTIGFIASTIALIYGIWL